MHNAAASDRKTFRMDDLLQRLDAPRRGLSVLEACQICYGLQCAGASLSAAECCMNGDLNAPGAVRFPTLHHRSRAPNMLRLLLSTLRTRRAYPTAHALSRSIKAGYALLTSCPLGLRRSIA